MSVKLAYRATRDNRWIERTISPAGNFSLTLKRNKHRYVEEFAGEMTISGDDFDWVMAAGSCTEIYVECTFQRVWNGIFTHTDCKVINLSKKFLEVTPRIDDEYSKIEPWMDLDFNIVTPFAGINSKVPIYSVNQYGIETKTVRIEEPYDGFVAEGKTWEGYSVNDWIKTNLLTDSYALDYGRANSLISYLNDHIPEVFIGTTDVNQYFNTNYFPWSRERLSKWPGDSYPIPFSGIEASDQDNQLLWLDYGGYVLKQVEGDLRDYLAYYRAEGGLYTLYEIRNIYDDDGVWEYCDLVYTREFYEGVMPPSGNVSVDNSFDDSIRGWVYFESDKKWYRRPYNAVSNVYPFTNSQSFSDFSQIGTQATITCDGNWFSELIDTKIDGKNAKIQFLKSNYPLSAQYGSGWYLALYEDVFYDDHFHKPMTILKKFIEFVRSEGAPTSLDKDSIVSQFWEDETNPYTNEYNVWKNVLIGQNSDVKRPLATEQATKEIMTFNDYLDMICSLTNTAWAIIDGNFVIEHISYFEKGLAYAPIPESDNIINPYSIINIAKNKGFMRLTEAYHYDKINMPKFEIFKTSGGIEPKNNNLKIEYNSGCVNNLPKQNIKEINLDATLDYEYARSEGDDAGITFLLTTYLPVDGIDPPVFINKFLPEQDEYGRFVFNRNFSLEDVIRDYHDWGRSDDNAELNGVLWEPIQPFKNVIQNVAFRYKVGDELMENPYAIVATSLGYGIIRNLNYTTKGGYLEYELGINPIVNAQQPEEIIDWYLHVQSEPSKTWTIEHDMNTLLTFRPVAFDNDGNEIEYNSLFIPSFNRIVVTFSGPVAGSMHFISMNLPDNRLYSENFSNTKEVVISDPLADRIENVALGIIMDNFGHETIPDSIEYEKILDERVDVTVKFNEPFSGVITLGNINGLYMTNFEKVNFDGDSVDVARTNNYMYMKPVVLKAGKEVIYNSQQLLTSLRRIGLSESIIGSIIVMEKSKT